MKLIDRYSRQKAVIGEEGQARISSTSVAIFGVGGLGSLVAFYAVGGGFRRVYLVDFDTVALTDLHRQVLYTAADVGKPKAQVAAERLSAVNGEVEVVPVAEAISPDLAARLAAEADVLVDALDNWASRHVVNAAAVRAGKPLIHGAVQEWYGHATTVIPGRTPCLEDLFGRFKGLPSCVGFCPVVGPVVGAVASAMAAELFAVALGAPRLAGRLVLFDFRRFAVDEVKVERNPSCPVCGRP